MKLWATLILETAKSNDEIPVGRDSETGRLVLLDAAYDLEANHEPSQCERILTMVSDLVKTSGHPCGVWCDDVPGVYFTLI